VGINAYATPNTLFGCLNDVNDVKAEIVSSCGFNSAQITTIVDDAATASTIKTQLNQAVQQLKSGDRFLFWFSGHGSQLTSGDASTDVICPIDFDGTASTSVTVQDFHSAFSRIPAGVTAFWGSDSCHSGDLERDFYLRGVPRLFRMPSGKAAPVTGTVTRLRDISDSLPAIALLSGCHSDQTSADALINNRYNGAFTYYFLNQLQQPGGLQCSLTRLVPLVQAAISAGGYTQVPQLSGPSAEVVKTFLGP
jgi:hypothetical protein